MTQEQTPKKLSPQETILKVRRDMIDVWTKNLMAETALQLMGHVMLGQAITESPELNDKAKYVQFKDDEFEPANVTTYYDRVYVTSLRNVTDTQTITSVIQKIKDVLGNALRGKDKVVARSFRLLVSYEGSTPSADVVYTLAWMTYKEVT